MTIWIDPIDPTDKKWVQDFLLNQAGNTRMVSRGVLHQCDELPGFIASRNRQRVGLLTYRTHGRDYEVVTLHTAVRRKGVGFTLLKHAENHARQQTCDRIWLITTNDNEPAIAFYKACGWQLTAVHQNALAESRKLKPEIPLIGLNGIPLKDEIEFEIQLT